MLFNSWQFLVFIILVFLVWGRLPSRLKGRFLLLASYIFYGAWDWRFLGLLAASTTVDFLVARALPGASKKKLLVVCSVVTNLGLLGVFKYFDFFIGSLEALFNMVGLAWHPPLLNVILPVGISFYTFQTMSYTIDVYRGVVKPCRDPLDFALYVSFFPQLVAGPIERPASLLPQLTRWKPVERDDLIVGGWLILRGFFKKMVVADSLARVVGKAFAASGQADPLMTLFAVYGFAFQIYCDFSGYTDIARGEARLMGVRLMQNFERPYLAVNPSEFWRRWHISLSTWLRDYLYIPLGGNRKGASRTRVNLFLTMLLGGLWHGAAWNFVLWGAYHGLLLGIFKLPGLRKIQPELGGWRKLFSMLVMFHLTCFGWLLFRVESMGQLGDFLQAVFRPVQHYLETGILALVVAAAAALVWGLDLWTANRDDPRLSPGWTRGLGGLVCGAMFVLIILMTPFEREAFIYFQF